jgi:hypothetical protein
MRKLFISLVLALSLSACTTVQYLEQASGVLADPKAVYITRQTFNALEITATNYIKYCTPNHAATGCSDTAIQQIIPAVRSGRVARSNLTSYAKANPGAGTPASLYNALVSATNTLQSISAQYNIGGAK